MDDLPESSGSWDERGLVFDPDLEYYGENQNETYETYMGETPRMAFWVNGVLHTIISISGIISMSQTIGS